MAEVEAGVEVEAELAEWSARVEVEVEAEVGA